MDDAAIFEFESVLERMLNLSLNSPDDSHGAADQLAAAAATENGCSSDQPVGAWAKMVVTQMASAATVEDARCCAARILDAFGGSVCSGSRAAQVLGNKDRLLGTVMQYNSILKTAAVAQHRRHLEDEEKSRELQGQIALYRDQVRRLEEDKYALSMHLSNAGPAMA